MTNGVVPIATGSGLRRAERSSQILKTGAQPTAAGLFSRLALLQLIGHLDCSSPARRLRRSVPADAGQRVTRADPVDLWTGEEPAHKLHRPNSHNRSGQMMRYKPRTSSRYGQRRQQSCPLSLQDSP
jgi:hypothetical protein